MVALRAEDVWRKGASDTLVQFGKWSVLCPPGTIDGRVYRNSRRSREIQQCVYALNTQSQEFKEEREAVAISINSGEMGNGDRKEGKARVYDSSVDKCQAPDKQLA